ncbi:MAG: NUDIX domain-containing protein [Desulfuromonadales bacterium]|nr:NUDIX domain-containing protein [Desulfuromonadales bacterium]
MGEAEKGVTTALHVKARFEKPAEYPERFPVPDDLVGWEIPYAGYAPPYYVSPVVLQNDSSRNPAGWADPEGVALVAELPAESFSGVIRFDSAGRPLNPAGRTGIAGRGLLGKWGPNFAADPIITRINHHEQRVEMLAVQRRDNGQWAIPGGMVDRGEEVSRTLARELQEETGVVLDMGEGVFVYQGYVDDPRNTDNAWMETTAKHLHLDHGLAERMDLQAGDDARAVRWLPLSAESIRGLYASHCALVSSALAGLGRDEHSTLSKRDRGIVESLLKML